MRSPSKSPPSPASAAPRYTPVTWCIRPEDIRLTDTGGHPATILDTVRLGAITELRAALPTGHELSIAVTTQAMPPTTGDCRIHLPPEAITVWPAPPDDTRPTPASNAAPSRAN